MATDYFGVLGADPRGQRQRHQARLPAAGPRPAPRRQPRPGGQGALPGGHPRLRGADRPGEAPHRRPRRRPVRQRWRRGAGGFGGAGFGGLGDIMDAFFGGAATRGPRSRTRAGRDALIPVELELDETVFGTTKDITVDTAVLCSSCTGAGTAPGTHADHLHDLLRARRGAERPARLPRPGRVQPQSARPARAPARSSPSRAPSAPATGGSARAAPSR